MFDFLKFNIYSFIDIFAVAFLLYQLYRLIRGTVAVNIFLGFVAGYFLWRIVDYLEMELLSGILGAFFQVGFLALIIIFQQEIRRFLLLMGSNTFLAKLPSFLKKSKTTDNRVIQSIINALTKMSSEKTGALIVLKNENDLSDLIQKGDQMNIEINAPIIESIFYHNSPLHDGAVIVEGNKITSTRSILPVSYNQNIPSHLGLRHRAAIGITEKSDAVALVVSEETGFISYIKKGIRTPIQHIDELEKLLAEFIK
ncbi:diadenylate cyclase [Flavobacteriaceae bacterium UJ101]|nr:diadenylate cyclase [Flavobacteriaceae bacterium UJ101]